jgi:hypothetical protein
MDEGEADEQGGTLDESPGKLPACFAKNISPDDVRFIVNAAAAAYCPQYIR